MEKTSAFVMRIPTEAFGGPLPQIFLLTSWKNRGKMGITKIMKSGGRELFRVTLVEECVWEFSVCPKLLNQPSGIIMLNADVQSVV